MNEKKKTRTKSKLTLSEKITKRTFRKYNVSESDAEIISQIKWSMRHMGYSWEIVNKVEKLMYRDYCTKHTCPKCKHCGKLLYLAILDKPVGIVPRKPICVGCVRDSRLQMFTPKMTFEQAWLKATS